jgi:tetratricopeptide (TPR) repeat protein
MTRFFDWVCMQNWAKYGLIVVLVFYAGVIVWTFGDYGVTPDERHHVAYGESVVLWYTTGFQERRIFTWADVWLYGGFYDTLVHLMTRVSPLDLYDTRHLCNAFVGLLGVWIAYRLGSLFGSRWIGLLAAVFLILTPRYYGHAFNNNKDIPFAVLYLWSVFWQIKVLWVLPRVPWRWVIITGLVTGLTMGIRVGGVLLVGYAGLFWGLWYFLYWKRERGALGVLIKDYVLRLGLMFVIAYGVMLVFWPWAQTDPLRHPLKALTVFSQFPGGHLNFFEGAYFHSYEIPWYYAPKWLLLTLPEFVWVGLLCGMGLMVYRKYNFLSLQTGFLGFAALFPLFYLMVAGTPLYNATRHFMFVVPPLVVLAGYGFLGVFYLLEHKWRIGLCGVVGVMVLVTASDMVRLHPFQTTFFNRSVGGGLWGGVSVYDTDNYNNGYKQGALWLMDHVEKTDSDPIRVAGGAALDVMLDGDRFVIEDIAWRADYYLTTTNMRQHTIIPGEVVHTVARMGVPLLYVIRPDTTRKNDELFSQDPYPFRDLIWGKWYAAEGRWEDALAMYQRALQIKGSEADVYGLMGEAYAAQEKYEKSVMYYKKALDIGANAVVVGTKLGNVLQSMGALEASIPYYERALEIRPNYLGALMNLGRAYFSLRRNEDAVVPLEKVVFFAPDQSLHFQRLGLVYYQMGRSADAIEAFKRAVELDRHSMLSWYHLGLALEQSGYVDTAEDIYLQALEYDAHRPDIWLRLASIYRDNGNFDTAVRVLMTLLENNSNNWEGYYLLGQIYEQLGEKQIAIVAYEKVLALNPEHENTKIQLSKLKL